MKRNQIIQGCIVLAVTVAIFGTASMGTIVEAEENQTKAQTERTSVKEEGDRKVSELLKKQKETWEQIQDVYDVSQQEKIREKLEEKKASTEYTFNNMLIERNPFGTNSLSLYVYFNTEDAVNVAYTVHVKDSSISDFGRNVYQEQHYQTEHEFQVVGLVPEMENQITFFLTRKDGSTDTKRIVMEMGSVMGSERVNLERMMEGDAEELEAGLYVVMGDGIEPLDFMYYYDNEGVLRGEIPLLGYRSHRLIFDQDSMYYSISETKMAQVNRIGQVTNIYDLGRYQLHHDYVFDENGNMLILATDTEQDSVGDVMLKLDVNSGEVTEVLDLGDLFASYKSECQKNSMGELDWMHIDAVQWIGNESVLLSSRETSSIIKVDNIYDAPVISYMIGEKSFWADTEYESLVFGKDGEFTSQGGQHSIAYVEDDSLEDGQYYLYMFNNNIGISESKPDYDWSSIGLAKKGPEDEAVSYYYKYLVDENAGTYCLVDSFEVPYSEEAGSAQEVGGNVVACSGTQAIFGEYDAEHKLIASYKIDAEKGIYRVYKYDFGGFYFEDEKDE